MSTADDLTARFDTALRAVDPWVSDTTVEAAVAVADAELAALVADRDAHERHAEELSQVATCLGDELDAAHNRADEAEAKVRAIEAMHWPEEAHRLKQQRDALRFQVEAVEALAAEWWPADVPGMGSSDCAEELRAALYPAQPDWTPERIETLRAVLAAEAYPCPHCGVEVELGKSHACPSWSSAVRAATTVDGAPQPPVADSTAIRAAVEGLPDMVNVQPVRERPAHDRLAVEGGDVVEVDDAAAGRLLTIMGGALDQSITNTQYLIDRGRAVSPEALPMLLRARELRDRRA